MDVAILHDFMSTIGGGEKTVLTLAKALDADLITTDLNEESVEKADKSDVRIRDLGPLFHKPPLKQIHASLKFAGFRPKNGYDFFILSGNWAMYAAKKNKPNLLYCHTPVRVFYDLREWTIKNIGNPVVGAVAAGWISTHRWFHERYLEHVQRIVVNSNNVKRRVKRYYDRDSTVIYPPVPTKRYRFERIGDFWLSVNRLYPEKRIDLQLEIFRRVPHERLKIVGSHAIGDHSSAYISRLGEIPENVEFLGEIEESQLIDLYANCKGLIATAVDEDFGLTPVEAMASGKVTLATDEGGYRETIIEGKTGWFLPPDPDAFADKIANLEKENLEAMKESCVRRAREFDEERFIEKMKGVIGYS